MTAKILVVDDESLILKSVSKALSKMGYLVTGAQNMQELEAALGNAPFDLLISDIHMVEDTVDNIISKVKQTSPSVQVLLMSGSTSHARNDHFIEKPFTLSELREKVKACLNEPR
jgi:DNA-binding NtrC family response regulator